MNRRSQDQLWAWHKEPLDWIERHPLAVVCLFSAFYFTASLLLASKKLLWSDELFTYYVAHLPHLRDVWKALATGAEQTPPFFYVITRAAFALLGVNPVSIRLPEILGFWVMCVCLFCFVAKRSSALFGLVAMLFPLVTQARYYATEGRAYALVLGFSAFALLCWRWAIEGAYRRLALVGLTASLAAAVSSHYYAVLVLVPFAVGELVRSIKCRRFDAPVWIALGLSFLPLLLFFPLIESARTYAPTFWAKPHWTSTVYFYSRFLFRGSVVPLLLLLVACYAALRGLRTEFVAKPSHSSIPAHEGAAAIAFLLIPTCGVLLGKTIVGAYSDKYALWAIIGVSIVIAWGLARILVKRPAVVLLTVLLLFGICAAKEVSAYQYEIKGRQDQSAVYAFLEAHAQGDTPIAIASPLPFLELTHYSPRVLARRLLYLADPKLAVADTGEDDIEKGLIEMKRWAGANVQSYRSFLSSREDLLIYTQDSFDPYQWLIPELGKNHWSLKVVAWQKHKILLFARPGHARNGLPSEK